MLIGYIDENMKNIGSELQREQIAAYATENNLDIDLYSKGTDISDFTSNLKTQNHTIIFANVVALGTTLKVICQNIKRLAESGNTIILAKENIKIIPEEWQEIVKGIELAIDIRSSLTSTITCKALSEVKASGKNLGRKSPNKKHFYTGREEEIKQKLVAGMPKTHLAKELGVTPETFFAFLRKNPQFKLQNKEKR